jgi:hypothetical protein
MRIFTVGSIVIAALMSVSAARAATFAGFGDDSSGPGFIITAQPGSVFSITNTGAGPYDGSDDTYIGVINNSGTALSSINLSSTFDIMNFDGDGIDTYGAASNAQDGSGYGGPNAYFTNVNSSFTAGTVNFITAIPDGGQDFFSLEDSLSGASGGLTVTGGVPEPSTWAMMILGLLMVGVMTVRRQIGAPRLA